MPIDLLIDRLDDCVEVTVDYSVSPMISVRQIAYLDMSFGTMKPSAAPGATGDKRLSLLREKPCCFFELFNKKDPVCCLSIETHRD